MSTTTPSPPSSDDEWRGCAANFPQPVNQTAARNLMTQTHNFNCLTGAHPLPSIEYRSSSGEQDIRNHVFRWDAIPYQEVFENGFQARRQQNMSDELYYNLEHYVNHGGRPLDSGRLTTHAYVSTTLNSGWHPSRDPGSQPVEVYRYEIYAPGGIWVAQTLGDRYLFPAQDEICFVGGIARQYIRSAQRFRLTVEGRFTRRERVDTIIRVNGNYNPQMHPPRMLRILRPVFSYEEGSRRPPLTISIWIPKDKGGDSDPKREKREAVATDPIMDWYTRDVGKTESYIDAAFRSSRKNEVYLFMKDEYVLVNYAPATKDDKVVNGPLLICDGFPSLSATALGEYGIDCAFGCHDIGNNQAFIFSSNLCARIDYAPGTTDDKIIQGPTTIAAMFPFFKGTVFESGVDAAFESTRSYEAYLFKGSYYALINYGPKPHLVMSIRHITQGFAGLKNTIFEGGIDAAFASHVTEEAYLFKGDSYALINFAPGTTNDRIIGGVKKIRDNWPSLKPVLPRTNQGLDVHDHHTKPHPDRDHDEL